MVHRLTMRAHISNLKAKTSSNVLKILSNLKWGTHPQKMSIYKALIESRILYGSIGLDNKNLYKNIHILHNKGIRLRVALGLTKSTPISFSLTLSSEFPIEQKDEIQS